jgi:hypothetical protein
MARLWRPAGQGQPAVADELLAPPMLDFRHEAERAVLGLSYRGEQARIRFDSRVELTDRRDEIAGNIFILEAPVGSPVSCLFWGIMPGLVDISVVQRTSGGDVNLAKQALGEHPHTFLVGKFIQSLAGVLDGFTDATITLDLMGRHHGKWVLGDDPVYHHIRDRFFDREKWSLNADRLRVRELLGEDNRWIAKNRKGR